MIRKLLMTIVFFIVLGGTAYAVPINYYYSGVLYLSGSWPTVRVGDTFTGSFSYDDSQTPNAGIYTCTNISLTIGENIVSENNIPFDISYSTSSANIVIWARPLSGEFDGVVFGQDSALHIGLYYGPALGSTGLPGSDLTIDDFEYGGVFLAGTTGNYPCCSAGDINYLSTIDPNPVPEPATAFLLGTGLVGLVGAGIRKKKK